MKFDKNQIKEIDRLIRSGHHGDASRALNDVLEANIPRAHLYQVAALCRRLSRSQTGIALLNPVVRPSQKKVVEASEEERLEYAACLIRLGGLNEATRLLEKISTDRLPASLLFHAFAHIARWDFEQSSSCLERMLEDARTAPYERLIAKVNLGLGYVFLEDFERAISVLSEAAIEAQEGNNKLLYSNSLELLAQAHIMLGDYSDARTILARAEQLLESSDTIDAYFIRKDQAILKVFESSGSQDSLKTLDAIRDEARTRGFWEQLRDCTYYLAVVRKKLPDIQHLYFGTPFPSYRKQLLKKLDLLDQDLPDHYAWQLGGKATPGHSQHWISVETGENSNSQIYLKDGQVPQRLFAALAHDFYRPRRLMELFDLAFPNEHFSIHSSPDKIHQGLMRLRRFFQEARVPLIIREGNGLYWLESGSKKDMITIKCPKEASSQKGIMARSRSRKQRNEDHFKKALALLGAQEFTAAQFARSLRLSNRTALRVLQDLTLQNQVESRGKGRQTRYVLRK